MNAIALSGNAAGIFIALFASQFIAGCSATSDEQQVRAVIAAAESAAEARNTSKLLDLVADDYVDSQGFDKAQLQQFLRGYFFVHPKIELATTVSKIEFETADRARVRVDILMVGTERRDEAQADSGTALSTSITGDTESLQVEVKRLGSEWRVTRTDRIAR